ncbi:IMP-specific 5'-nucleotidase 1 [Ascosphaera apis ARSEF 7405]|uniref:IMP-specific 5'-nucleotidase 1 n=1 Tax=Ascosphaera apis ARSEF 7405 TaxID=392613 RepID=A0A162IA92_9EURO|nr:IMP-specific 5'-nucleotidase 1 [Ascosphaera apis ARSEF 7405]
MEFVPEVKPSHNVLTPDPTLWNSLGIDALRWHRRDQFIEWIKGLLAVPFVLDAQPTELYSENSVALKKTAERAATRYAEILKDVEHLIQEHVNHEKSHIAGLSKLKLLVPSIGPFFTPLPLADAFWHEDNLRQISRRRFVPPSFNDIRMVLNTSQIMGLAQYEGVDLITFDGDLTIYEYAGQVKPDSPIIQPIINLLRRGKKVGIVTAVGFPEPGMYYKLLQGLLDAIKDSDLSEEQRENLIICGGECNFMFRYSSNVPDLSYVVPRNEWALEEMLAWTEEDIQSLLDVAETALRDCRSNLNLPGNLLRKPRAVGIWPLPGCQIPREKLEESVMVLQQVVEKTEVAKRVPFCAFNGGNDVFIDIGDKSYGVMSCQKYFGGIPPHRTLHIGDQFLSATGANDFKARIACTTAWVTSPEETALLLNSLETFEKQVKQSKENSN